MNHEPPPSRSRDEAEAAAASGPPKGVIAIGPSHPLVEDACVILHNAYEAAAIEHGWRTQARSRKPWCEVPEANRATMRTAMTALLVHLGKGHYAASEAPSPASDAQQ